MATTKQTTPGKQTKPQQPATSDYLFGKENYLLMLVGVVVLTIGFLLMVGGKSADPTKFNDAEIYSVTRITIAPIVILAGFIIEIFAIMKQPKKDQ